MNERIGQLAEEAALLGPSSRIGNSHEAAEKFALLIINQCIDIIRQQDRIPAGFLYPKQAGIHENAIREYFGI